MRNLLRVLASVASTVSTAISCTSIAVSMSTGGRSAHRLPGLLKPRTPCTYRETYKSSTTIILCTIRTLQEGNFRFSGATCTQVRHWARRASSAPQWWASRNWHTACYCGSRAVTSATPRCCLLKAFMGYWRPAVSYIGVVYREWKINGSYYLGNRV